MPRPKKRLPTWTWKLILEEPLSDPDFFGFKSKRGAVALAEAQRSFDAGGDHRQVVRSLIAARGMRERRTPRDVALEQHVDLRRFEGLSPLEAVHKAASALGKSPEAHLQTLRRARADLSRGRTGNKAHPWWWSFPELQLPGTTTDPHGRRKLRESHV